MAEQAEPEKTVVRIEELEKTPQGKVRRWLSELALADEAEREWRKEGNEIYSIYEAENTTGNAFNILWSNTETMLPAVYNSTPEPDVRRRFRDPDTVGKVASTVLERALSFQVDDYDFDDEIEAAVLDVLLPGRGIARIVYEPHFAKVTPDGVQAAPRAGEYQDDEVKEGSPTEPVEDESYEKVIGQDARCEHVQWDKFRHGPGKRWTDVPWVSFEHDFTYDMAVEKFSKAIADQLDYEDGDVKAIKDSGDKGKELRAIFKTCKVHEIWDKEERRVLFIAPTFKKKPLLEVQDPLKLKAFFPTPRPIYAIRNSRTLVPKPLYRMYKRQAVELDKVTVRINKITYALKVRGMYAAHIEEAADLLDADDNAMIAIKNPSLIAESGGLDKMIWIMPLDALAKALEYLYSSREQLKQTIYEISGISDILRGTSKVSETATAQQLKSQWGSLRIQKLQRDIQRFIRDLLRLKAEVIAEQFMPEQLAQMTNIQLPDQQAKEQAQQAIQQAQMAQQPPPPQAQQVLAQPTWDDVMGLMRSDAMRQYRVDIETDSTVAETINRDMQGLAEVIGEVSKVLGAVAQGLPMDVAKNIALAVIRRARMGSAVEDALESLEQPPPPPPQPQDNSLQVAQLQEQAKQTIAQMSEQNKQQIEQIREQGKAERAQIIEQMKNDRVSRESELDAAVKVIVAQINTQKTVDAATAATAQREFARDVQ